MLKATEKTWSEEVNENFVTHSKFCLAKAHSAHAAGIFCLLDCRNSLGGNSLNTESVKSSLHQIARACDTAFNLSTMALTLLIYTSKFCSDWKVGMKFSITQYRGKCSNGPCSKCSSSNVNCNSGPCSNGPCSNVSYSSESCSNVNCSSGPCSNLKSSNGPWSIV